MSILDIWKVGNLLTTLVVVFILMFRAVLYFFQQDMKDSYWVATLLISFSLVNTYLVV